MQRLLIGLIECERAGEEVRARDRVAGRLNVGGDQHTRSPSRPSRPWTTRAVVNSSQSQCQRAAAGPSITRIAVPGLCCRRSGLGPDRAAALLLLLIEENGSKRWSQQLDDLLWGRCL
jgi:hypothetical protein